MDSKEATGMLKEGWKIGRCLQYDHADIYLERKDGTIGTPLSLAVLDRLIAKGIIKESSREQLERFTYIRYSLNSSKQTEVKQQ